MDTGYFLLADGSLDEDYISNKLKKEIQEIKESTIPEEYPGVINELIFILVRDLARELTQKKMDSMIPGLFKLILEILGSFGIENINMPLNVFADMLEIMGDDKKAKKCPPKHDKRNAVLNAAKRVFSKNGFHDAHVDEIANLAGVAKGTVYRYFSSKEEILKELIIENNRRLVNGLSEIFNRDEHILELIKEAIAYYVDFFDGNKELYKILTHTPWTLKDVSEHFYKGIISHLQMIRRRILALSRDGVLKTTDFYTVFYGIFGFIDGVIQKWFRRNCEYSLKDELPVIIEVLFYGFVGDEMRRNNFSSEDDKLLEPTSRI